MDELPFIDAHETIVAALPEAVYRVVSAGRWRTFHVTESEEPSLFALEGSHPFSRYSLVFRIEDLGHGSSRLRAETRAVFPGVHGAAYRALVIGTGGHVVAVRRMIGRIKRTAEEES